MELLQAKNPNHISKAARILADGGIGAFPTETVYGLGGDALDLNTVARIFEAKGRPIFDPLIVHVSDIRQVERICRKIPKEAKHLMKRFWPGPLTFILPKKEIVPDLVTAGLDTVAVRMPQHPVARKLLKMVKTPLAAPSANRFGSVSATDGKAAFDELLGKIDFVLDAGPCSVGIESTIVKITKKSCEILRPGGIPIEQLRKVLGRKRIIQVKQRLYEAPGQLKTHYATRTPLIYLNESIEKVLPKLERLETQYKHRRIPFPRLGFLGLRSHPKTRFFRKVLTLSPEGNLTQAASQLFQAMRRLDREQLTFIIAEKAPNEGLGLAIQDRLERASVGSDPVEILRRKLK